MVIPSDGGHGILSIKSLAFLTSSVSLATYLLFYKNLQRNQVNLFLFLICFLIFITLWIIHSAFAVTDISSLYDQFKLIFITLSVVAMTLFIAQEHLLSYENFLKTIVYANFCYSLIKIIVVFLFLAGFIDLEFFLEKIGVRFMSMAIYGDITRLQTSVDILTPFILYFVLQSRYLHVHFNPKFKYGYTLVSLLAILLSFSRFLLIAALLSLFLGWCLTDIWSKFKWFVIVMIVMIAGTSWIGYDKISTIVELRFFSRSSYESDSTRTRQIDALVSEFHQYPLLGKGVGSYSEKMIRDKTILHSYEVQWVAFLMQFGLIGLSILLVPLILICLEFITLPFSWFKTSSLLIFLTWLAAGFFNPFLISLSSGIMYALFAWTGRRLRLANQSLPLFQFDIR